MEPSPLLDFLRDIVPTKGHFDDYEVTHAFPHIGQRTMLLNARKLYRPGNRTVLLVLAIEDITERKRAEAQLAALHQRDRRIAAALQRALLFMPSENAFPGLEVKMLHEAASDEALVGGDFWDIFAYDNDHVAFVIGDVMGHGLTAAVFTAEIRLTLRAFLREHEKPAIVLNNLNNYLCESHRLFREGLNDKGMIENNRQLAATLFQMESFADTPEGMRRHAQEAEPSVFAVTSGGFVNLLRERIAEAKAYVEGLPDAQERPTSDDSFAADSKQAKAGRRRAVA